jgi:hypothetical protein
MEYSNGSHSFVEYQAHDKTYIIRRCHSDWHTDIVTIEIKRPWYLPNKKVLKHVFNRDWAEAKRYYTQLVDFYKKNTDQLPLS